MSELKRVSQEEYEAWVEAAGDKLRVDPIAPDNMTVHKYYNENVAFRVEMEDGSVIYNTLDKPAEDLGMERAIIFDLLKGE